MCPCYRVFFFKHFPVALFLNHSPYHRGILQCVQQDSATPLDDISKYIFKQVNHFYSYTCEGQIFVSGHQTQKCLMFMTTIFLSLFFLLQEHINSTILMDVKQWVRALLLFLVFGLSILIAFIPFINLIIIVITIIIIP